VVLAAGGYASPQAFGRGVAHALTLAASLSVLGALAATATPGRRRSPATTLPGVLVAVGERQLRR
jgi:hypothetical protein